MYQKFSLITLLCWMAFFPKVNGQERTTVKLNRHFQEIVDTDSVHHHYTKMETLSKTGETVTWIFDLQNKMVKQSKKGLNPVENYNQEITETFDSTSKLLSQRITNLDNRKYVEFHYRDGVKKAQVISHGNDLFEIWRNNPDSLYTNDHDDFGPGLDKKEWQNFLIKNLRYPQEARNSRAEGTVILAILVNENGEIEESEVANEAFVNPHLAKEALRVLRMFKGKFTPAINLEGQAEAMWITIPVRFKLS